MDTNEAIDLIRRAVRELDGVPIYLVAIETLSDRVRGGAIGSVLGGTAAHLDLLLRPTLDWQGRGIAIVYSRTLIEELQADLVAIIVHEIAHALADDYLADITTEPDDVLPDPAEHMAALVGAFDGNDAAAQATITADTLRLHGPRWFRFVLHLRDRCAWQGASVSVSSLIGYAFEHLPVDVIGLHHALLESGEYSRFAGMTFAEIARQPLPLEFIVAWNAVPTFGTAATPYVDTGDPEMNVFDLIKRAFAKKERDEKLTYAGLVRAVANGEHVQPEQAADILRTVTKTPEDLQREAQRIIRRRELRAKIAERNRVLSAFQDMHAKIDGVRVSFAGRIAELEAERDRAVAAIESELPGGEEWAREQIAALEADEHELRGIDKHSLAID